MKNRSLPVSLFFGLSLSAAIGFAEKAVEFTDDVQAAFSEEGHFKHWMPGNLSSCKDTQTQYETRLAQDKAAFIWKRMMNTRYEALPEITGAGFWEILHLLNPFSNSQAFTHEGDFMAEDRAKDIHHFGTAVMVQYVPLVTQFTGIFKSGADYGVARFSLARPADANHSTPGMGIKFFVDGRSSVNMEAMYQLTGQEGHDIFRNNFSNVLPDPHGDFMLKVLGYFFGWGLWQAGQSDGDPKALSSHHLAKVRQDGSFEESAVAPFQLVFEPTMEAHALLVEASNLKDFRSLLEGKGKGMALYNVWGNTAPGASMIRIGTIKATSHFLASHFGDETLYFKHHRAHSHLLTEEL